MAVAINGPKITVLDSNGDPISGAKIYTYEIDGVTEKTSYDGENGSANANPVLTDAAGRADVYLDGQYQIDVYDADDVLLYTENPVTSVNQLAQQWINKKDAAYVSANSFTITGNVTSLYTVGRRIKLNDSSVLYGEITASSYSSPNTTVTVEIDGGATLSVSLDTAWVSVIEESTSYLNHDLFVNTISDLKAIVPSTLADGEVRLLLGYASVGDGGGGIFRWDASDTTADDNGIYIQPDAGGAGRWIRDVSSEMVNINWFGAIGNDSARDSAISYCKSNDKALFCPAGDYDFTTVMFTGVTLAEEAAGGKGLKGLFGEATDLTIFKFATTSIAIDNVGGRYQEFSSFTIEGDATTTPSIGLLLARVDRDTGSGSGPSASEGWYNNIEIRGNYSTAAYYNYAAEETRMENVTFENKETSGSYTIVITDTNVSGVTSASTTIAGTTNTNALQSTIGHWFNGCQIFDYTANLSTESGVLISGGKTIHFKDLVNYSLLNSAGSARYFEINNDSGNGGANPVDIVMDNVFYHESSSEVAVYVASSFEGFRHVNCRGAAGGIVFASGVNLSGNTGAGEHNIVECEVFDGSAADVDVLGRTDVYVDTSFSVSDFFIGNVFVPDGGATITITDPTRFLGAVYYEDGTEYRPNQPWVKVNLGSDQTNVTGDGTEYTIPFATEIKDTQSEFSSSTFTAKYTGRYLVSGGVRLENLTADTYERATLTLSTSNRDYIFTMHADNMKDSNGHLTIPFNAICDMDASDTLQVKLTVAGGTKSVTVAGVATNGQTWLDVSLLC